MHAHIQTLLDEALARFAALSPEEQAAHIAEQRASFARGMTTPCEHGQLDFEQCVECRKPVGVLPAPVAIPEPVARVLKCLSTKWAFPAANIAETTQLPIIFVRKALRALEVFGIAEMRTTWDEDSGLTRGRGYFLTEAGRAAQR